MAKKVYHDGAVSGARRVIDAALMFTFLFFTGPSAAR